MSDDLSERLRAIEARRLGALIDGDIEIAGPLHADDYQLITPGGASLTKEEYLGQIASGELSYRAFEPMSEVAVRTYEGAAIVRYRVHIEATFDGGHDDDRFWHTDLYELRDGRWQAVWSQATRIR